VSTRQCAFIKAKSCPIDVDEMPLDVCKLCIDAWKTSAEIQTLTGANLLGPTIMVPAGVPQQVQYVPMAPVQRQPIPPIAIPLPQQPITLIPTEEPDTAVNARNAYDMLHRLDNQFINDRINAEEYVKMRRNLVDNLMTQRRINGEAPSFLSQATESGIIPSEPDPDEVLLPPPSDVFHVIDLDDNMHILNGSEPQSRRVLPLLLIERNQGKIGVNKYPVEWKVPRSLDRNKLESIYDLYEQLREDQEKILLQFNGTKLGLLGKKNNSKLCKVLESDEKIEDYAEEIRYLTKLLSETDSVDDFVSALPQALNKTKDLSP
jgi:hypothetical protein